MRLRQAKCVLCHSSSCICMFVHVCMPWHTCGAQKKLRESGSVIIWDSGIEFRAFRLGKQTLESFFMPGPTVAFFYMII